MFFLFINNTNINIYIERDKFNKLIVEKGLLYCMHEDMEYAFKFCTKRNPVPKWKVETP